MANYCEYKVIAKGARNAWYAFFGSMSCADYKKIESYQKTQNET